MEKLVQIIISDEFQNGEGQPPIIVNPTLSIDVPVIPTAYSLAITVLTKGIEFTEVNQAKLELIYCNPKKMNNRIIIHRDLSRDINFKNVPKLENKTVDTTNFNFNLRNLFFKEEGKVQVVFTVDDDVFKQNFLIVIKGDTDD